MTAHVIIIRPISTLLLERSPFKLGLIRRERENARALARQQLHATPHLSRVTARIVAGYPVLDLSFEFDVAGLHHYRKVGRCEDCDRRWGDHSEWEKAK